MSDERSAKGAALDPSDIVRLVPDAAPAAPIVTADGSAAVPVQDMVPPRLSWRARRAAKKQERATAENRRRLSREELRERLRISSAGLIEEIHAVALRQNQAEDQRETRLDGKATSLLATSGLSATVAFAFGGMLGSQSAFFAPLEWGARVVPVLYVVALLFGLLSTIWALFALRIRDDYKTLADEDLFNEVEFERIQRIAQNDDKKAQAEFRRYITIQHWTFYRAHGDIHAKKADLIKWGQRFFVAFVCMLLLIGGGIAYSAFSKLGG